VRRVLSPTDAARRAADNQKIIYAKQTHENHINTFTNMNYTGGDPVRALTDKQTEHESQAGEMDFIAKHIDVGENYLLDSQALVKLGICKNRY
jgi:hypothetical protein